MEVNPKPTVLVVDCDSSNVDTFADILVPKYNVLVANSCSLAFGIAQIKKPDLIMLDVYMPDMTGFEAIIEFKRSDETRHIPIIFVTSSENVKDEEMGFFLGAVDYIKKPFHTSVVLARVKTHLQMQEYIRTIERLGMIDALTNIPNRRSFDQQLAKEWERAMRDQNKLSILMIDVDQFKNYNDKFGHTQGDVLLQTLAGIFTRTLKRAADFVARWGGEEFAVLLPSTDTHGALAVAEQIRKNVAGTVIHACDGESTQESVSIGVYTLLPSADTTSVDLLAGADAAMYSAKAQGRNRVCAYNQDSQ